MAGTEAPAKLGLRPEAYEEIPFSSGLIAGAAWRAATGEQHGD